MREARRLRDEDARQLRSSKRMLKHKQDWRLRGSIARGVSERPIDGTWVGRFAHAPAHRDRIPMHLAATGHWSESRAAPEDNPQVQDKPGRAHRTAR